MVYGVGYIGQGKYKSKTNTFHTWRSMLRRCYSEVYQTICFILFCGRFYLAV